MVVYLRYGEVVYWRHDGPRVPSRPFTSLKCFSPTTWTACLATEAENSVWAVHNKDVVVTLCFEVLHLKYTTLRSSSQLQGALFVVAVLRWIAWTSRLHIPTSMSSFRTDRCHILPSGFLSFPVK